MKTMFLAIMLVLTIDCIAQVERNTLTVDGITYEFDTNEENAIKLVKDIHGNWNLLAYLKIDGKSVAFNIATAQEKMATGTYPLMNRVKKIEEGKVAFSITIMNDKDGALAALSAKQLSSAALGSAEVKDSNGVYSITLANADALNIKQKNFTVSGNITLDPNELKSRKERTKENDNLNMHDAFMNESAYCIMQDEKLESTFKKNETNLTKEIKIKLDKTQDNIIASLKEMLKILNRKNDGSVIPEQVNNTKEIVTKKLNELKEVKADKLREYIEEYREKTWIF